MKATVFRYSTGVEMVIYPVSFMKTLTRCRYGTGQQYTGSYYHTTVVCVRLQGNRMPEMNQLYFSPFSTKKGEFLLL